MPVLLLCTVGGTSEPIVASIKATQPDKILFVVSPETANQVSDQVLPALLKESIHLNAGQYDLELVDNAQDLFACVEVIKGISGTIEKWQQRGDDFTVVVDITGGTKCMTAAVALVARRWKCSFSYVGGTERTKDGVGIVVSGKEQIIHTQNPWDSLGYQAIEEAVVLLDQGDYEAAQRTLTASLIAVRRADIKSEINALNLLSQGYQGWDLFNHRIALEKLECAHKDINNFAFLTPSQVPRLRLTLEEHLRFLSQLRTSLGGRHFLLDLCTNAQRCADRGRYDDAVARLYRTIEATAQLRLREHHNIADTSKVPVTQLPPSWQQHWAARSRDGTVALGLQDDYALLKALNDPMGEKFEALGLSGNDSSLKPRNASILAHGFSPVSREDFQRLWKDALVLANITLEQLPQFPKLGASH